MSVLVVLHKPQDLVNIAVVIRGMCNFGVEQLRLVQPEEWEPHRVQGIAHKAAEVVARTTIFDTLDEALADCTFVAGMTARGRTVKRNVQRPADAAEELLAVPPPGRAAVLLGPEDRGLSNTDLDRCHRIVSIPTAHNYESLNLAQAATIMLYELFTRSGPPPDFKPPRRDAPPATREMLELLFGDIEEALSAIEFFKSRTKTSIMRTVREVIHRTPLDVREASLAKAMAKEVVHYLERKGVAAP
jgi:TrmH family RNA methyltransferase